MTEPRRRRRTQAPSPTSMIVNFFLDAPLEVALSAMELAQALITRRLADKKPLTIRVPYTPEPVASPSQTAVQATLAQEAAPASLPAPVAGVAKPRQRAKRSDAGQPRKRVAAVAATTGADVPVTATRRRGRPPITLAPATPAPVETLPIPELPPQDVPYEARDVD